MILNNARKMRPQRGLSLLETLLAVGVAGVFFLFMLNIGRTIANEQAIQAAAGYVDQIDAAVTDLYASPERFNIIYDAVLANGGILELTLTELRDGGAIANIPATPILGTTFPSQGPIGQTYSIIMRIADNTAITTDPKVLETFIVSNNLIDDALALRISSALGGNGGVLRNTVVTGGTIRSAFGSWSAPTSRLIGSPWYNTVAGAAIQPTITNGAYVASYHYYDLNRIAKDYLYRNNQGDPALNRMESDLALNNFNVLGVDNINVSGTITGEEMLVQGAAVITSNANVIGNLQADGPSIVTGNVTSPSNLSMTVNDGTLAVQLLATTENSIFSGTVTTPTLQTGTLTAENATITNGIFNTAQTTGINANLGAAGFVVNGNTNVGANFDTTTLNTQDLTIAGGNTGTVFMKTDGTYDHVSGNTTTRNYTGTATNRVGNTDWRCGSGC